MYLNIEHLGNIEDAIISLNGVTLLNGDEATGKTTAKKALFTALNPYTRLYANIVNDMMDKFLSMYGSYIDEEIMFPSKSNFSIDTAKHKLNIEDELKGTDIENLVKDCKRVFNEFFKEHMTNSYYEKLSGRFDDIFDDIPQIGGRKIGKVEIKDIKLNHTASVDSEFVRSWLYYTIKNTVWAEFGECAVSANFSGHRGSINLEIYTRNIDISIENTHICPDVQVKSDYIPLTNVIYFDVCNPVGLMTDFNDFSYIYGHNFALLEMLKQPENESLTEEQEKLVRLLNFLNDNEYIDYINGRWYFSIRTNDNLDVPLGNNISKGSMLIAMLKRLILNGSITERSILIFDNLDAYFSPNLEVMFVDFLILFRALLGVKIVIDVNDFYTLKSVDNAANKYGIVDDISYHMFGKADNRGPSKGIILDGPEAIWESFTRPINQWFYDDVK